MDIAQKCNVLSGALFLSPSFLALLAACTLVWRLACIQVHSRHGGG